MIFSASFGEGHNTAARALEESLTQLDPHCVVERVDLFRECYPKLERLAVQCYLFLINDAPKVWSIVYRLFDTLSDDIGWLSFGKFLRRLQQRLQPPPFAFVSTYPLYPFLLRKLYGDFAPAPLHTIITDSITINRFWHAVDCDSFLSPNQETTRVLLERGVSAEKIFTFGFPVSRRFADLQQHLKSDPCEEFRILYSINSGHHYARQIAQKILELPNIRLTVLTGRNTKLRAKLTRLARSYPQNCVVLGWTEEIPRLMGEHHLLVSKAGGATTQEALAAALPMVVPQLVPGQEEGNLRLLTQKGFGFYAANADEVVEIIGRFRKNNCALWKEIRGKMITAANPHAADKIAQHILEFPKKATRG